MSDLDFELDIQKYTLKELEELIDIKFPYTPTDINEHINILKKRILDDKHLENSKQKEIIDFLHKVHAKLVENISSSDLSMRQNVITNVDGHFIIDRVNQRVREKKNNLTAAAQINPHRVTEGDGVNILSKWQEGTITQLYSFDSRFRQNYFNTTSTNFTVNLPVVCKNVVTMELCALEIPATYFSISKKLANNFFHIYDNTPKVLHRIALPDGNYTREEMETLLNSRFTISGLANVPVASIDTLTGRVVIDLKNAMNSMYFNLRSDVADGTPLPVNPGDIENFMDTNPIQMKLGWVLGYRNGLYKSTAPTPVNVYVGEGIFDGWGDRYFYFVCDDFHSNHVTSIYALHNSSVMSNNILARLTRSAASSALDFGFTLDNNTLNGSNATRQRYYYGPVDISKLHFRIVDTYGRTVDINNMDISFAIKLEYLYE